MKHLLTLSELGKNDITHIFDIALQMRRIVMASYKKGPQLLGSTVAGIWRKPCVASTAFSLAAEYLSGTSFSVFDPEDVLEQCRCLDNMGVNTVVLSCENDNLARLFSKSSRCAVVNGGSGQSDPVGVLADLMALTTKLDGLHNLSVLAVGNRDTNKIAELNYCLELFDSGLIWYLPPDDFATTRRGIVLDKAEASFKGADAVIDIGLSAFSDPAKYYGSAGGITENLMDLARIEAPLLGSRYVVDNVGIKEYPYSIVNTRQSCYVSAAMAVLYLLHKA